MSERCFTEKLIDYWFIDDDGKLYCRVRNIANKKYMLVGLIQVGEEIRFMIHGPY
jgi:hypothetical protein